MNKSLSMTTIRKNMANKTFKIIKIYIAAIKT